MGVIILRRSATSMMASRTSHAPGATLGDVSSRLDITQIFWDAPYPGKVFK